MWRSQSALACYAMLVVSVPAAADDASTCNKASGQEALAACDRAIASGRFSARELADLYNDRGAEWLNQDLYARAITDFSEAIRVDPSYGRPYRNRGSALRLQGNSRRALADFDQAIRIDPGDKVAYRLRGVTYQDRGDFDHAIADFDQSLRLDARYVAAYVSRGNAYSNKEIYDRAISSSGARG